MSLCDAAHMLSKKLRSSRMFSILCRSSSTNAERGAHCRAGFCQREKPGVSGCSVYASPDAAGAHFGQQCSLRSTVAMQPTQETPGGAAGRALPRPAHL